MNGTRASKIAIACAAALAFAACSGGTKPDTHTPQDYAGATSTGNPDGTLTTIAGPDTPVLKMTSSLRFPKGDAATGVRSVLMYDRPSTKPGACFFEAGYKASGADNIIKEDVTLQPCDGKQQARFRVAGVDIAFVGRLVKTDYKGTPVTLFEISDQTVPETIHLVY